LCTISLSVGVSNINSIGRVGPIHMLEAATTITIMSIAIVSSISRSLAIMVDAIAIRSVVVGTALVNIRAGTSIVSSISRSLAIMVDAIAIRSMIVRAALVNIGACTTIVSSISRSLSIVTIMSMKTLWASMIVACSMAIVAITRLSLPLSIVTISIASQALGSSVD